MFIRLYVLTNSNDIQNLLTGVCIAVNRLSFFFFLFFLKS